MQGDRPFRHKGNLIGAWRGPRHVFAGTRKGIDAYPRKAALAPWLRPKCWAMQPQNPSTNTSRAPLFARDTVCCSGTWPRWLLVALACSQTIFNDLQTKWMNLEHHQAGTEDMIEQKFVSAAKSVLRNSAMGLYSSHLRAQPILSRFHSANDTNLVLSTTHSRSSTAVSSATIKSLPFSESIQFLNFRLKLSFAYSSNATLAERHKYRVATKLRRLARKTTSEASGTRT